MEMWSIFILKQKDCLILRPNLFYNLPGKIKGYTFLEFYNKGGYFGKTILNRPFKNMTLEGEIKHINDSYSKHGMGIGKKIQFTKDSFLKFKLLPLWFDKAKLISDNTACYSFNVNLPHKTHIGGFGEINLTNNLSNARWGYGELEVGRKMTKRIDAGYCAALKCEGPGKIIPRIENRVFGRVNL